MALGGMEISMILALLIGEHGIFSHLFVSSSIFSSMSYSFQCVYIYLSLSIYIFVFIFLLVEFTPRHFIVYDAALSRIVSFSDSLLLVYRYGTNFFMLNFFFFF